MGNQPARVPEQEPYRQVDIIQPLPQPELGVSRLLEIYDALEHYWYSETEVPIWHLVCMAYSKHEYILVKAISTYHAFREAIIHSEQARIHMNACDPENVKDVDDILDEIHILSEDDDDFIILSDARVKSTLKQ